MRKEAIDTSLDITHVSSLAVRLEELSKIELRCLEDLRFSDVDVLEREDTL